MPAKRLALRALTALVILALAWFATGQLRLEQDDRTDEPEWTAISVVTARQLSGAAPPGVQRDRNAGDLDDAPWRQGVQATTFGWANPILHKLVWAFACEPVAPVAPERVRPNLFFRYHKGDFARANAAIEPLLPAIERARLVVAAASALCGLLLFLIAKRLVGWAGGVVALGLWLFHPLVRAWSHQARPDFGMLALVLATLYFALAFEGWLRGGQGRGKQLGAAALLGLVAGMAAGAKLNGGLAGVFAISAVFVTGLAGPREADATVQAPMDAPVRGSWTVTLGALALAGTAFALTLFACLPYLWSAPVEHLSEVLDFWSEHMAFQQDRIEAFGGTATRALGERVALVARRLGGADEPLGAAFGLPAGWLWVGALASAWWLLRKRAATVAGAVEASATNGRRVPLGLASLWLAIVLVGSTLWIPLDWDRYLFAPVACAILVQATVIGSLLGRLAAMRAPAGLSGESPNG